MPAESTVPDVPPLPEGLDDLRGQVFEDRYEVSEIAVVGSDHVFFYGRTVADGRAIVLELFAPASAGDRTHAERLEQRVKATGRVRHPSVVCPIDAGERFDGSLYLVSERPPGVPLPAFVASQPDGRLPWALARPLLLDLVRGLATVHKRRLVHGAVRPGTCWVEATDHDAPRLRLLGLGSNVDPGHGDAVSPASGTAPFAGDPHYVAPECIRGRLGDARSDAYLVGLVAYFVLVGRPPFTDGSPFQVLASHLKGAVPSAREHAPGLPPGIDAVLARLLAKASDDRPATLAEVEQALLALEAEVPAPPSFTPPEPTPTPPHHDLQPLAVPAGPSADPEATTVLRPDPSPSGASQVSGLRSTVVADTGQLEAASRRWATDAYDSRPLEAMAAPPSAPCAPVVLGPAVGTAPTPNNAPPSTEIIELRDMALDRAPLGGSEPGRPVIAPAGPLARDAPPSSPAPAASPAGPSAPSSSSSLGWWLLIAAIVGLVGGVGVGLSIIGR